MIDTRGQQHQHHTLAPRSICPRDTGVTRNPETHEDSVAYMFLLHRGKSAPYLRTRVAMLGKVHLAECPRAEQAGDREHVLEVVARPIVKQHTSWHKTARYHTGATLKAVWCHVLNSTQNAGTKRGRFHISVPASSSFPRRHFSSSDG